jgi:hypothetical protein
VLAFRNHSAAAAFWRELGGILAVLGVVLMVERRVVTAELRKPASAEHTRRNLRVLLLVLGIGMILLGFLAWPGEAEALMQLGMGMVATVVVDALLMSGFRWAAIWEAEGSILRVTSRGATLVAPDSAEGEHTSPLSVRLLTALTGLSISRRRAG